MTAPRVLSVSAAVVAGLGLIAFNPLAPSKDVEPQGETGFHQPDFAFPIGDDVPGFESEGVGGSFDLVMTLGSLDGTITFGQIADVAVSEDSLIAVADRFGCAIRVFKFPSGGHLRDIGGCGDGPGEFRGIIGITFRGDTLVVSDFQRGRIAYLDAEGTELRSMPAPFPMVESPFTFVAGAGDGLLFAPAWRPGSGPESLIHLLRDDGEWIRGLEDTQASRRNPERILRESPGPCVFRRSGNIAALNRWHLQLLVLDPELNPSFHHRDEEFDLPPRPGLDPGGWLPQWSAASVACGDSTAVWTYRKNATSHDSPTTESGVMFVATESGDLLWLDTSGDAVWPHLSTMIPADGLGDTFFFYSNAWGPYPQVRAYEFRGIP